MAIGPNQKAINKLARDFATRLEHKTGIRQERSRRKVVSIFVGLIVEKYSKTSMDLMLRVWRKELADIVARAPAKTVFPPSVVQAVRQANQDMLMTCLDRSSKRG